MSNLLILWNMDVNLVELHVFFASAFNGLLLLYALPFAPITRVKWVSSLLVLWNLYYIIIQLQLLLVVLSYFQEALSLEELLCI